MMKRTKLFIATSAALLSLTGCGGSSDSNNTDSASVDTKTGYFIDSEVKGVEYKTTSGKTGKTNNKGQFSYQDGDKVTFHIGKLELGTAAPGADGLVTPKSISQYLAGDDEAKAREIELLLLRVLQSIDVDNDPTNGITINPALVATLGNVTETTIVDSTEGEILNLDEGLRTHLDEDGDGKIDVNETDAETHGDDSIVKWERGERPEHGDNENEHGEGTDDGTLSAITNDQKYSLAYMWNEERLAYDIYTALNSLFPAKQFENISTKSEVKHIAAVENLVKKYDIDITNLVDYTVAYSESDLRAMAPGTYGVESVQALYDSLYAEGKNSKIDALKVACKVEVTDVDDLDNFIEVAQKVNAADLVRVFDKLRSGSYNHYWTFDSALKAEGVSNGCASLGAAYAKTEAEYPRSQGGNGEDHESGEGQGETGQGHENSEGQGETGEGHENSEGQGETEQGNGRGNGQGTGSGSR